MLPGEGLNQGSEIELVRPRGSHPCRLNPFVDIRYAMAPPAGNFDQHHQIKQGFHRTAPGALSAVNLGRCRAVGLVPRPGLDII